MKLRKKITGWISWVSLSVLILTLSLLLYFTGNHDYLIYSVVSLSSLIIIMNFFRIREFLHLRHINQKLESGINQGLAHIIELNFEGTRFGEINQLANNLNQILQELKSVFWVIKENLLETKLNNATLENIKLIMISYIQKVTNIGNVRKELENICKRINDATSSTKEILNLIIELANKTRKEAAAIKQASDAIESLLEIISKIITITRDKQKLAVALKEITSSGGASLQKTSQVIRQLNENADEMLTIVRIIDDIAEATNILSINTGIEAAHTGAQGRGFRVIADEIKKLVTSTKKNAASVAGLLKEQVKNISLAAAESQTSSEVFSKVNAEVEDAAATWIKISEQTVEMSHRAGVIKDATTKMIDITNEVMNSSDSIKQSVEQINTENRELDETSSRTLEIITRVTITNEEARKSTMDILQQLNEMGVFVKKLNKSIDFFNLGKKIFYYNPDFSQAEQVAKKIVQHEYEIYPVKNREKLLPLLKEFANALLIMAFDNTADQQAVYDFITALKKSPDLKEIGIGLITGSRDATLVKLEKQKLCEIIQVDKKNSAAELTAILQFIRQKRARGLRKNLRVNCSLKDNITLQLTRYKQTFKGNVTNLSSSAALVEFGEGLNPLAGSGDRRLRIQLNLDNQPVYLNCHSLQQKEGNVFIVNFSCAAEEGNRERLFDFIYTRLQVNLIK